ncbi:MAG: RICIN domain-containing protein [Verrucomicrobiota bacterium]
MRLVLRALGLGLVLIASSATLRAQDRTILFSPTDSGVSKPIPNWGLDTAWYDENNVRRGAAFMGSNRVDVVRISFTPTSALVGGDLQANEITTLTNRLNWVKKWSNPATTVCINEDSPTVDSWFKLGTGYIDPARWAQLIEVTTRRAQEAGRTVVGVAPFNEPDYYRAERLADMQTFYDTAGVLTNYPRFITNNIRISGGNTLNTDQANPWYNFLKARLGEGNTHQLAGSFDNYASFYQNVVTSGDHASNDELHNVMEAMVGAEYGMQTGIWWGTAEYARSEFVKASDGQRLGYAEHRPNWTAASVYRGTNGAVQAFVGESERQALPTTYRFFSKDRDVFYDGYGPRRDYTVTTTGGSGYQTAAHRNAEKVVNITWGADVPPPINGRYLIVNRNSGKVLQVPGGSPSDGVVLQQSVYVGTSYQQWDVQPLPYTFGGDSSYFTIRAAHSGVTADVQGGSYANGAIIQQWNGGTNVFEQWILQYAGNGYFKIRTRWCNKVMAVSGTSTANGAQIVQWDDTSSLDQQWRLIPTNAAVEFSPPAAPTGVTVTANALSVQLNWDASAATDLAGYTVLRATNSGGPFETVARGLTNNSFTDKAANRPQTCFYIVKAVDRSLNTSLNYPAVSATPTLIPALVARYGFDGNTNDSSGNANYPIITAGTPTFVAGKYGSAVDFDGSSQYTMLPANMLASVTNFTFACWVNWDGGNAWQRIFDFGNDTTQYMFLTPSSGNGTLRFAVTTNGGGAEQILETSPLPVGQWRHVAVTRNGNIARLYTNGVVAVSRTNLVTITPASFNPALNYLGKSQWPDPLFNGRLDELFIYNYALSDAEITRLATNQPPPPTASTSLAVSVAGGFLLMSWPTNYLGCRLESNAISLTAPGSWFAVPGSATTNQLLLPINADSSNVFFRLVYP